MQLDYQFNPDDPYNSVEFDLLPRGPLSRAVNNLAVTDITEEPVVSVEELEATPPEDAAILPVTARAGIAAARERHIKRLSARLDETSDGDERQELQERIDKTRRAMGANSDEGEESEAVDLEELAGSAYIEGMTYSTFAQQMKWSMGQELWDASAKRIPGAYQRVKARLTPDVPESTTTEPDWSSLASAEPEPLRMPKASIAEMRRAPYSFFSSDPQVRAFLEAPLVPKIKLRSR